MDITFKDVPFLFYLKKKSSMEIDLIIGSIIHGNWLWKKIDKAVFSFNLLAIVSSQGGGVVEPHLQFQEFYSLLLMHLNQFKQRMKKIKFLVYYAERYMYSQPIFMPTNQESLDISGTITSPTSLLILIWALLQGTHTFITHPINHLFWSFSHRYQSCIAAL